MDILVAIGNFSRSLGVDSRSLKKFTDLIFRADEVGGLLRPNKKTIGITTAK